MKKPPKNRPKKPKSRPQKDPITLQERLKIASKGDDFLEFGALLSQLKASESWKNWGYSSFRECVKGERLGTQDRAYMLVRIWEAICKFQIPKKKARPLGMVKLDILAKWLHNDSQEDRINSKAVLKLLEEAKKRSTEDFRRYIAVKSGGSQPNIRLETKISSDLRNLIGGHIEEMMNRDDIPYEAIALRRICEEWRDSQRKVEVDTKALLGI
jgi:hypothetical protein